jgi:hypothetical protein
LDDPRPCPTIKEVYETMDKIKTFEDSIDTIWLREQLKQMNAQQRELEHAII